MLIESLVTLMSVVLLRQFIPRADSPEWPEIRWHHREEILEKTEKVKIFMAENLEREISLHEVARYAAMSPFHLLRLFKQVTGLTPLQYLTSLRINKAKELLLNSRKGVTEVGLQVGYSNPSYFSAIFRRKVGQTPAMFRRGGGMSRL